MKSSVKKSVVLLAIIAMISGCNVVNSASTSDSSSFNSDSSTSKNSSSDSSSAPACEHDFVYASEENEKPTIIQSQGAKYVCAKGQADAFFRIQTMLSEDELNAFRRGRNAHSGTVPKNANVQDYRVATGLEALIGYLYCLGQDERIGELMHAALQKEE